ncbi:phosphomannomutase CpsG [Vibrio hangzhouensis]|uniref:phosphomannomutase n=1 Tax=Vibrio hangzhouensis TaxID=462991 RepID=A0A1H5TKT5_9VIBR|nr:phosphomannomutase CpsG [Vibrio hangzhouensis]SEF62627.1 phosphomannomutase [Vibrio hangzhouensis]
MEKLNCFKAYDIRGKLDCELNETIAYRIGRAFGEYLRDDNKTEQTVVVGGDIRLTSEVLKLALAKGVMESGINVIDIGKTGTEEVYFTTFNLKLDGGIQVTASHNPIDYNGMKLVREEAKPISGDSGLRQIQLLAERNQFETVSKQGQYKKRHILNDYISHILGYIYPKNVKPMKIVVNSGNGAAGHVIDELETQFKKTNIPLEIIKIHNTEDGTFPNGIPNPLLPECRSDTSNAVKKFRADMGVAFDGDFDRCFFFDENGDFIEGYYIVGLLAEAFLHKEKGAKIIHDPRLYWNTVDIAHRVGGTPILSKTGHAFIKERMRKEDAIYGGEMSAHHYFREFSYCDSGMIPWLLVTELLSLTGKKLSETVAERIAAYPASGEINLRLENTNETIEQITAIYRDEAIAIDKTDGISCEFKDWRFNLRFSNTEPVARLNVESKADLLLMKQKTDEILSHLNVRINVEG